ncbi:MAG: tetratricopeptide (TPR) repeat protein [Verrucomicrobiales bacterium]|jgi:tetratricopeptide (TPR) repeat protein
MKFFAPVLFLLFLASTSVMAQGPETGSTLIELYDGAVIAGEGGNLDKAIALCDKAISEYGKGALELYGPVFGHFYYMKGMFLLRKKQYAAAIQALKICHENFDNAWLKTYVPKTPDEQPKLPNRFQYHALMQWGFALMAMKNYPGAVPILERTLAEDPKTEPRINRLYVMINLARCYILADQPTKGKDFIIKLIESDLLGAEGKRQLFMILCWDWSPLVKFEELRAVIHKYGHYALDQDPMQRIGDNSKFQVLAAVALDPAKIELMGEGAKVRDGAETEPLRALLWYNLMAPPWIVLEDHESRKLKYEERIAVFEAMETESPAEAERKTLMLARGAELLQEVNKDIQNVRKDWSMMLLGTGASHYQISSIAAARATYHELAIKFPNHKERPVILHNLVVCAVNLGRWVEAYEYGLAFFAEFPDHELKPSVARVLVEVLYVQGEYKEAFDICAEIRPELEPGSPIREIPDFVHGACAFHLDQFELCEKIHEEYIGYYPDGQRLEPVRFYLASAKVRLLKWEEAGPMLESFLTDYPTSPMRPAALFLSGLTHLVLEDLELAQSRISELQANFASAEEIPASHNVQGDIFTALDSEFDLVAPEHRQAKRYVEEDGRGDVEVAAYAIRQLITIESDEENWEVAVDLFDQFKDRYWNSSYRIDASIAALRSLVEVGRREEGLKLLVDFVNDNADNGVTAELDNLFGAYVSYLDDYYEEDEILDSLKNFPYTDNLNPAPALKAWVLMAQIEAMEGAEKPNNEEIEKVFYIMNQLFARSGLDLSNYTLVRLARWNRDVRGKNEDAAKIYDFVLNERGAIGDSAAYALVDWSKILLQSDEPTVLDEAFGNFNRALNETENNDLAEEATLGSARVLMKQAKMAKAAASAPQEKFEKALEFWKEYLSDRSRRLARPEANYRIAECYDELGKASEAKKLYVNVYANFGGHIEWSSLSILRVAVMLREGGQEKNALLAVGDYLRRLGHNDHPGIEAVKHNFFKWRDEFTAKQGKK